MNCLTQKTPPEIATIIAKNLRAKRKKLKLSQSMLASKSNVSLGSIKRFENKHDISLRSLIKIAIVLSCEDDFEFLFSKKTYDSIEEFMNE